MSSRGEPSFFTWSSSESATVQGAWTLANFPKLSKLAAEYPVHVSSAEAGSVDIDFSGLTSLDTVGALCLYRLLGQRLQAALNNQQTTLSSERRALLLTVIAAAEEMPEPAPPKHFEFMTAWLERVGISVVNNWDNVKLLLGFIGVTLVALVRNLLRPGRWRVTSMVFQIETIGLDAVPIVALLTFMVGAVVAFLGATILADFGATIYTIDLVGFSFLREFAVLLTAILMAGRTASSFTAQIGSMKVNEEIDAIRMSGLDPIDLLVMPRLLAMMIALPILTFIGMVSGIFGGMLVSAFSLDISPTMFFAVFREDIALRHFYLGMSKAPIFAYVIGLIGCLEGLKVSGSAESVGRHTTSAVVQSIFLVILIDAVAALFFMEMGW